MTDKYIPKSPWNVYPKGDNPADYSVWNEEDNFLRPDDPETRLAIARVLSAAPDLLESLEEVTSWAFKDTRRCKVTMTEKIQSLNRAAVAVRKAHGEGGTK